MSSPSGVGSNPGGSQKLNTLLVNQKNVSALRTPQGFNVFILSPTQLKELGLVAKVKNGKPVIVHDSKDSVASVVAEAGMPTRLPDSPPDTRDQHGVAGVSVKASALKMAFPKKTSNDDASKKTIVEVNTSASPSRPDLPETTAATSMEQWRLETRRYYARFSQHWRQSLEQIGYINCPLMACNYISLTEDDMKSHYMECDGKPSISTNACPVCMQRLGTDVDLVMHMKRSHPGDGFHKKTFQQMAVKSEYDVSTKLRLLPKRRSFCKVHKVSWNISLESKGYVKCLFQNCSYLALTVEEMIQHYGICNGGGNLELLQCPYVCRFCHGSVESLEKLVTHMKKSHVQELVGKESEFDTGPKIPIPSRTKIKPKTEQMDSYIITLNSSFGNMDDKDIELISMNDIKIEPDKGAEVTAEVKSDTEVTSEVKDDTVVTTEVKGDTEETPKVKGDTVKSDKEVSSEGVEVIEFEEQDVSVPKEVNVQRGSEPWRYSNEIEWIEASAPVHYVPCASGPEENVRCMKTYSRRRRTQSADDSSDITELEYKFETDCYQLETPKNPYVDAFLKQRQYTHTKKSWRYDKDNSEVDIGDTDVITEDSTVEESLQISESLTSTEESPTMITRARSSGKSQQTLTRNNSSKKMGTIPSETAVSKNAPDEPGEMPIANSTEKELNSVSKTINVSTRRRKSFPEQKDTKEKGTTEQNIDNKGQSTKSFEVSKGNVMINLSTPPPLVYVPSEIEDTCSQIDVTSEQNPVDETLTSQAHLQLRKDTENDARKDTENDVISRKRESLRLKTALPKRSKTTDKALTLASDKSSLPPSGKKDMKKNHTKGAEKECVGAEEKCVSTICDKSKTFSSENKLSEMPEKITTQVQHKQTENLESVHKVQKSKHAFKTTLLERALSGRKLRNMKTTGDLLDQQCDIKGYSSSSTYEIDMPDKTKVSANLINNSVVANVTSDPSNTSVFHKGHASDIEDSTTSKQKNSQETQIDVEKEIIQNLRDVKQNTSVIEVTEEQKIHIDISETSGKGVSNVIDRKEPEVVKITSVKETEQSETEVINLKGKSEESYTPVRKLRGKVQPKITKRQVSGIQTTTELSKLQGNIQKATNLIRQEGCSDKKAGRSDDNTEKESKDEIQDSCTSDQICEEIQPQVSYSKEKDKQSQNLLPKTRGKIQPEIPTRLTSVSLAESELKNTCGDIYYETELKIQKSCSEEKTGQSASRTEADVNKEKAQNICMEEAMGSLSQVQQPKEDKDVSQKPVKKFRGKIQPKIPERKFTGGQIQLKEKQRDIQVDKELKVELGSSEKKAAQVEERDTNDGHKIPTISNENSESKEIPEQNTVKIQADDIQAESAGNGAGQKKNAATDSKNILDTTNVTEVGGESSCASLCEKKESANFKKENAEMGDKTEHKKIEKIVGVQEQNVNKGSVTVQETADCSKTTSKRKESVDASSENDKKPGISCLEDQDSLSLTCIGKTSNIQERNKRSIIISTEKQVKETINIPVKTDHEVHSDPFIADKISEKVIQSSISKECVTEAVTDKDSENVIQHSTSKEEHAAVVENNKKDQLQSKMEKSFQSTIRSYIVDKRNKEGQDNQAEGSTAMKIQDNEMKEFADLRHEDNIPHEFSSVNTSHKKTKYVNTMEISDIHEDISKGSCGSGIKANIQKGTLDFTRESIGTEDQKNITKEKNSKKTELSKRESIGTENQTNFPEEKNIKKAEVATKNNTETKNKSKNIKSTECAIKESTGNEDKNILKEENSKKADVETQESIENEVQENIKKGRISPTEIVSSECQENITEEKNIKKSEATEEKDTKEDEISIKENVTTEEQENISKETNLKKPDNATEKKDFEEDGTFTKEDLKNSEQENISKETNLKKPDIATEKKDFEEDGTFTKEDLKNSEQENISKETNLKKPDIATEKKDFEEDQTFTKEDLKNAGFPTKENIVDVVHENVSKRTLEKEISSGVPSGSSVCADINSVANETLQVRNSDENKPNETLQVRNSDENMPNETLQVRNSDENKPSETLQARNSDENKPKLSAFWKMRGRKPNLNTSRTVKIAKASSSKTNPPLQLEEVNVQSTEQTASVLAEEKTEVECDTVQIKTKVVDNTELENKLASSDRSESENLTDNLLKSTSVKRRGRKRKIDEQASEVEKQVTESAVTNPNRGISSQAKIFKALDGELDAQNDEKDSFTPSGRPKRKSRQKSFDDMMDIDKAIEEMSPRRTRKVSTSKSDTPVQSDKDSAQSKLENNGKNIPAIQTKGKTDGVSNVTTTKDEIVVDNKESEIKLTPLKRSESKKNLKSAHKSNDSRSDESKEKEVDGQVCVEKQSTDEKCGTKSEDAHNQLESYIKSNPIAHVEGMAGDKSVIEGTKAEDGVDITDIPNSPNSENASENSSTGIDSKSVKRRGRKRKTVEQIDEEKKHVIGNSNPTAANTVEGTPSREGDITGKSVKRRGRKKKIVEQIDEEKKQVTGNSNPTAANTVEGTPSEEGDISIKIVKRRGRKKKIVEQIVEEEKQVTCNSNPTAAITGEETPFREGISDQSDKRSDENTLTPSGRPKRRGRQKNYEDMMDIDEAIEEMTPGRKRIKMDSEASLGVSKTPPDSAKVKRRGRPPRSAIAGQFISPITVSGADSLSSAASHAEVTPKLPVLEGDRTSVIKRGRGRPPRSATVEQPVTPIVSSGVQNLSSTSIQSEVSRDETALENDTTPLLKRGLGRPPKSSSQVTDISIDSDNSHFSSRTRGRGRRRGRSRGRGRGRSMDQGEVEDASEIAEDSAAIDTSEHVQRTGKRRKQSVVSRTDDTLSEYSSDSDAQDDDDEDFVIDETSFRTPSGRGGRRRRTGSVPVQRGRGRRRRGRGRGRRGRGRATRSLANAIIRTEKKLESSTKKEDLIQVKCFKCGEEMEKRYFKGHNRLKHQGLAWLEGEEPIDFNDEKLLMRILTKVHQTKKWLICETCGANKKSVVGFISHLQCCQKSTQECLNLRVGCELCGRLMLPSSLKTHMYTVHKDPSKLVAPEKIPTLEELEEMRKRKRAAATKAVSRMQDIIDDDDVEKGPEMPTTDGMYVSVGQRIISNYTRGAWKRALLHRGKAPCRQPGCAYEADRMEEIIKHYLSCPLAPKKGYACRHCSFHCEEEPVMLTHVTAEHAAAMEFSDNSLSECDEEEDSVSIQRPANFRYYMPPKCKSSNKVRFLSRECSGPVSADHLYLPAIKWTLQFQLDNYLDKLYEDMHTSMENWELLVSSAAEEYLPETKESLPLCRLLMRIRILVNVQRAAREMKRLKLFEAEVVDGIPTIFTGGPVWAMAWCPLPLQLSLVNNAALSQYLAVSVHRGMENTYVGAETYSHPNMLQIWDYGRMDNQGICDTPKLALGLAHNYGTVWCMEWCPSGCYDTPSLEIPSSRLRRLGLLAAACSDGTVRVFSVCYPSELAKKAGDNIPVFKTKAAKTLVLQTGGVPIQCTRLSWLKGKGHKIIAAGFTNGVVALYDLASSSPLLNVSDTMHPFHSFQAHIATVTALALNPHFGGRFFMTGSVDRTIKFWDLEDTSGPITEQKRGCITDGAWMSHWVSAVNAMDDGYLLSHTNATLTPVRNFGFNIYPLLAQNSTAWCLSANDWANAVAQGTEAGELSVIFSHQLLISVDTEKGMKDKRKMISYMELKELDKTQGDDDVTDLEEVSCSNNNPAEETAGCSSNPPSRPSSVTPENSVADFDTENAASDDNDNASTSGPNRSEVVSTPAGPKYKTYEEADKKCGLILCDLPVDNFKQMPPEAQSKSRQSEKLNPVDCDAYPLSSINRVAWNPNCRSFLWVAAGYQNGLIRVPCITAMNSPTVQDVLAQAERKINKS